MIQTIQICLSSSRNLKFLQPGNGGPLIESMFSSLRRIDAQWRVGQRTEDVVSVSDRLRHHLSVKCELDLLFPRNLSWNDSSLLHSPLSPTAIPLPSLLPSPSHFSYPTFSLSPHPPHSVCAIVSLFKYSKPSA